jgi:hypothetical protein
MKKNVIQIILLALPNSNHKYPGVERIEINMFAEILSPI